MSIPSSVARVAAVLAVVSIAGAAAAQTDVPDVPAGPAVISGRLLEGEGAAADDVEVILYALAEDGRTGLRRAKSDAEGRFRFEGVSNAADIVYLVGARAGDVPFGQRVHFAAGELEQKVEISLARPTSSDAAVTVGALDLRLDRGCTHLRVSHSHELRNAGSEVVFIGQDERDTVPPLLEAIVPAEAQGFESFLGREGLDFDGGRVRFWGPLYPGSQEIGFGYGLPLDSPSLAVEVTRGADSLRVLSPEDVATVAGAGLRADGHLDDAGQRYAVQRGDALTPGASVELTLALAAEEKSPLRTPRVELWLELDDAVLEVDERIEVVVPGDEGVPESPATPLLCLDLPPAVDALRFSQATLSAGLRRDPSGVLAVHGPLPPGPSQLAISYQVPATPQGARLERRFDRELPLLTLLLADTGVVPETRRLHRRRSVRSADRNYLHLEAFSVDAGEGIELTLERTPPSAARGGVAAAGFAVLAGLAALGFLTVPLRGGENASLREADDGDARSLEREALRQSLEALDEDLETGKLTVEDHASLRAELRERAARKLLDRAEPEAAAPAAEPEKTVCPACDAPYRSGDRFCSRCGAPLGNEAPSA